jgi:hypothetical protein
MLRGGWSADDLGLGCVRGRSEREGGGADVL